MFRRTNWYFRALLVIGLLGLISWGGGRLLWPASGKSAKFSSSSSKSIGSSITPKSISNSLLTKFRSAPAKPQTTAEARAAEVYGKLPLSFECNSGQSDSQVKYLARASGYNLFLSPAETLFGFKSGTRSSSLQMQFAGANEQARLVGEQMLSTKSNYFLGNNEQKWRTQIENFKQVKDEQLYPGIDLFYEGDNQQLKYRFELETGADPKAISMRLKGAESIELDQNSEMVVRGQWGEVRYSKASFYQQGVDGEKQAIEGQYLIKSKREAGF